LLSQAPGTIAGFARAPLGVTRIAAKNAQRTHMRNQSVEFTQANFGKAGRYSCWISRSGLLIGEL
jgi:hypothetical protein